MIDPIDGTKDYIRKDSNYTVNIGLIDNFMPVYGCIYKPSEDLLYYTNEQNKFVIKKSKTEIVPSSRRQVLPIVNQEQRKHPLIMEFLSKYKLNQVEDFCGSSKFTYIAHGHADVYPRFGKSMEWDTAAGQAILRSIGGDIVDTTGNSISYGKPGFYNPNFIAYNSLWVKYVKGIGN